MALTLTSPAFADNEFVPVQYTCDGDNISPPLKWSDVPDGTVELVLIFEDPDGPGGMGGTQVYWVLFGLDPASGGLEEGKVPAGAVGGKNDYGRTDWAGPCPPRGRAHRYVFTLFAVKQDALPVNADTSAAIVGFQLHFNTLEKVTLTGKFQR